MIINIKNPINSFAATIRFNSNLQAIVLYCIYSPLLCTLNKFIIISEEKFY